MFDVNDMNVKSNETLLLLGVVGSTAYGLNNIDSDEDRLGVYAAPSEVFLGMGFNPEKMSRVSNDPDVSLHEIAKLLKLIVKCNPTVTEILFLEKYDVMDERMKPLVQQAGNLLNSDGVRNSYGGYALAQAKRLQKRNSEGKEGFNSDLRKRTAKHARHCFRLMLQGKQLLSTGSLVVNVSDQRDFIYEMGDLAVTNVDKFHNKFLTQMNELDSIESVLNDDPNVGYSFANDFLVNLRKDFL